MIRTFFVVFVIFGLMFLIGPFCVLFAWICGKPNILYSAGRLGCRLGMKLAGVQRSVGGRENIKPGKNYLFLANHQSYCDPPALLVAIPFDTRLILKKELRKLPLLGKIMEMGGFVFIDRKDRAQSVEGMKQAVKQLRRGESILIYPEGTRTRTGRLGPFKKGPFIMAIESGVPIIPISVSGSYGIMPPNKFRITPGTITVMFHPEIETHALSINDRDNLMDQVWKTIAKEVKEMESFESDLMSPERT